MPLPTRMRLATSSPSRSRLNIQFEKLLSDSRLLPWLAPPGGIDDCYEMEFIVDPADFGARARWKIKLTDERSFAAKIMTGIVIAFVQMHKLGHVLCGHIEANRFLTGRRAMAELRRAANEPVAQLERERAWESDADQVAAGLIVSYLDELFKLPSVLSKRSCRSRSSRFSPCWLTSAAPVTASA